MEAINPILEIAHPSHTHHHLKCYVKFFQPIVDGDLKAIARINDRTPQYKAGHILTLHEGYGDNGVYQYTGRTISALISFVDDFGLQPGYVNLSLSRVGMLIIP